MMVITYYNTLYGKECELNVFGDIIFNDGEAHFASGGHRYSIRCEHIRNIEFVQS